MDDQLPPFSYADPTIGAVFFNLEPKAEETASKEMQALVSSAKEWNSLPQMSGRGILHILRRTLSTYGWPKGH